MWVHCRKISQQHLTDKKSEGVRLNRVATNGKTIMSYYMTIWKTGKHNC